MRDWIDLGPSPPLEDDADYNDLTRARKRSAVYVELVRRRCGPEPPGAELIGETLDFGTASSATVLCYFHSEFPESETYARRCVTAGPQYWDNLALEQLVQRIRKEKES
jgi:hypothetical protein